MENTTKVMIKIPRYNNGVFIDIEILTGGTKSEPSFPACAVAVAVAVAVVVADSVNASVKVLETDSVIVFASDSADIIVVQSCNLKGKSNCRPSSTFHLPPWKMEKAAKRKRDTSHVSFSRTKQGCEMWKFII